MDKKSIKLRFYKTALIITIILINIGGWAFIVKQWHEASTANGSFVGRQENVHLIEYTECNAILELVSFDPNTGEANFILDMTAPWSLPDGYQSVIYRKLLIIYPGLYRTAEITDIPGDQLKNGETEHFVQYISIFPSSELKLPFASNILENFPLKAYAIPSGYYPFEELKMAIYMWVEGEYIKSNGQSDILIRPVEYIDFGYKRYQLMRVFATTGIGKGRTEAYETHLLPAEDGGFIEISFKEPLFPMVFIPTLFVMLTMFSFSILWIREISNVIQVALAMMFSIWGLSNIILPVFFDRNLRFGVEQAILLIYFMLGLITICRIMFNLFDSRGLEKIQQDKANLVEERKVEVKQKQKKKTRTKKSPSPKRIS